MIYNLNQMIVGFLIFQRIGGKRKRPFLPRAWFMTIFICFFMSSNWPSFRCPPQCGGGGWR